MNEYQITQLDYVLNDLESGNIRLKVDGPSRATNWLNITRTQLLAIIMTVEDSE